VYRKAGDQNASCGRGKQFPDYDSGISAARTSDLRPRPDKRYTLGAPIHRFVSLGKKPKKF
jgi:hypothetical protein